MKFKVIRKEQPKPTTFKDIAPDGYFIYSDNGMQKFHHRSCTGDCTAYSFSIGPQIVQDDARVYPASLVIRDNEAFIVEDGAEFPAQSGGIESTPEVEKTKTAGEIAVHAGGDEHAIVVDGYFIHIRKPEHRAVHIDYLQKFIDKMRAAAVREDREKGGISRSDFDQLCSRAGLWHTVTRDDIWEIVGPHLRRLV